MVLSWTPELFPHFTDTQCAKYTHKVLYSVVGINVFYSQLHMFYKCFDFINKLGVGVHKHHDVRKLSSECP